MDSIWKNVLWAQFGAAIDMFGNAVTACPETLWGSRLQDQEFWYVSYHALFWLDLYLSDSVEGFAPPAPFTLDELDPTGLLPDRIYTKAEIQTYFDHCRQKCRTTVDGLTDERVLQKCTFGQREYTVLELLLYNMRHVQEHASQLSLILGQQTGSAPGWVARAK